MTTISLNFTQANIVKIKIPAKGKDVYKDTQVPGLRLVSSYGGSKTFYLGQNIDNEYYRIKIGTFPNYSASSARLKAIELKSQIAQGIYPDIVKARLKNELQKPEEAVESEEMSFKELLDKYINDYAKHNTRGWKETIATMGRHASDLYNKKISDIQKSDIQNAFNKITNSGAKYAANRFIDILKAIFNKAIDWDLLEKNPTKGITKNKEEARDRYITSEEIPKFFKALMEEPNKLLRDFFYILLCTAARKGNVLSMEWSEINFIDKTLYIPSHKSKNGSSQLVALTDKAMAILVENYKNHDVNNKWVFPSERRSASGHLEDPKKSWKKLCKRADLPDLRLHDLRRTCASWMAISGASLLTIGETLNHKSPTSTKIYAKLSLGTVRESMVKAENAIDSILTSSEHSMNHLSQ